MFESKIERDLRDYGSGGVHASLSGKGDRRGRDMMRRRVACGEPLKIPKAIFKSSWCSPVASSSFGGCTRFTCSRKAKL